jgi:hypothetical protein
MAKNYPKSRATWRKRIGSPYFDRARNRTMRTIGASVDLWRDPKGTRATAFIAHFCVGRGRTKGAPQYCGMATGKNPRAAIANAARAYANTAESRSGYFAGYSKSHRKARRTTRAGKRSR